MVVALRQAAGEFRLPDRRPDRILLISAGSGITPVMSMLRTLCAEGHRGPITFLHYAPDPERAIYRDQLELLAERHPNLRLVRSYTRASGRRGDRRTLRSPPARGGGARATRRPRPSPAGRPACWRRSSEEWRAAGLDSKLHIESFVPPSLAPEGGAGEGEIHFAGSGVRAQNTGAALLEQAEEAGLSPQFGCRMGICHTCSCRKTAGKVKNLSTGEVSSSDDEEIQICVSAPLGDVVVDL